MKRYLYEEATAELKRKSELEVLYGNLPHVTSVSSIYEKFEGIVTTRTLVPVYIHRRGWSNMAVVATPESGGGDWYILAGGEEYDKAFTKFPHPTSDDLVYQALRLAYDTFEVRPDGKDLHIPRLKSGTSLLLLNSKTGVVDYIQTLEGKETNSLIIQPNGDHNYTGRQVEQTLDFERSKVFAPSFVVTADKFADVSPINKPVILGVKSLSEVTD